MRSLRPRMKTMIPFWRKIAHQDIQEVSLQILILYMTINYEFRLFDYLIRYKIL